MEGGDWTQVSQPLCGLPWALPQQCPRASQHHSSALGPPRGTASSSNSRMGRGLSPESMYQWAPVSQQVMRGTGTELQMVSHEARRYSHPRIEAGAGARKNITSQRALVGAPHSTLALTRPHSPARSTENPLSQPQERPISLPRRGCGHHLGAGFNKSFFSSFIPPHLHPGFPRKARFSHCTRRPLKENAIGPS